MSAVEPQLAYAAPTLAEYCANGRTAGQLVRCQPARRRRAGGHGPLGGDGALFLQVVDIAVRPDWVRRGRGCRIMAALMDDARHRAPKGVAVTLLAEGQASRLYGQFGFQLSAPHSQGMLLRL